MHARKYMYFDDILIRNRRPSVRYLHYVITRRVQFDYGTCRGIASSCLCKDDAFDVPDVYIQHRIYSAALLQRWNYIITRTTCIYAHRHSMLVDCLLIDFPANSRGESIESRVYRIHIRNIVSCVRGIQLLLSQIRRVFYYANSRLQLPSRWWQICKLKGFVGVTRARRSLICERK